MIDCQNCIYYPVQSPRNMSRGNSYFISTNNTPVNIKIAALLVVIAGLLTNWMVMYRKLRITSKFGRELDSLSDLVSFGMAPIVLWWNINNGLLGIRKLQYHYCL